MIRTARSVPLAATTAVLALAACSQPPGRIGTGEGKGVLVVDVAPDASDQLDILFVIDNSGSMMEQQTALVEAARASLFDQLVADLGHLPDLHLGIVSTDMGSGANNISSCSSPSRPAGDDGQLLTNDCAGLTGTWIVDEDDGAGGRTRNYQGDLADLFTCMGQLGTIGCGFEQPLAAAVRALDGTHNAGFLRPDALLLVVIVSDEDDCSVTPPGDLFGDPNGTVASPLGPRTSFRCFEFGVTCAEAPRELGDKTECTLREDGYLRTVGDLADQLRAVKVDPSKIMVAGIHGGSDGVTVVGDVDDPSRPMLATVCTGTDFEVTPALRLTAFERQFPARWILTPDCLQSTSAKLARITRATAGVLGRSTCLLGAAPRAGTCLVETVDPDGVRTARPDAAIVADPRCDYTEHHLRVDVALDTIPPGSRLQVRCDE